MLLAMAESKTIDTREKVIFDANAIRYNPVKNPRFGRRKKTVLSMIPSIISSGTTKPIQIPNSAQRIRAQPNPT